MRQLAFVIDVDRCIGCKGCQVACKLENNVGLGPGRSKVCTVGPTGTYPDLEMYFLPAVCQQCENPACSAACPTGACSKDGDGVVRIDPGLCVDCGLCRSACPCGCVQEDREMGVSHKCDLCAHLRERGDTPACVRNCAGGALRCGDLNGPDSEVSRLLAAVPPECVHTLADEGNRPAAR